MDYKKVMLIRKIAITIFVLIFVFPMLIFFSRIGLESFSKISGKTVETSNKINIFPVVKQDKFTILQTTQKRVLASDLTQYSLLQDDGEGKKQVEYDVREVSIKDTLEPTEQAYAEIIEKKNNIAILEKKIILYIPKDYVIQVK